MKKKYNILERFILQIIKIKISSWFKLEKSLSLIDNFIKSTKLSPAKTWPDPQKIALGGEIPFSLKNVRVIGKYLISCISQGRYSIKSIKKNSSNRLDTISTELLNNFIKYADSLGIKKMAFTKVPRDLIFKDRAIRYDTAIVLIMEMNKTAIAKAPSLETFKMVFETYDSLGIVTNKLTNYLKKNFFGAQASHPLGGLVLYPPLAQKAGLGWLGKHGLLITPEFGARQRISAIFTNIKIFPIDGENEHQWIQEYCEKCNKCLRKCPPQAIFKDPIIHPSKRETHIERAKCLPYFNENMGCSICIKVCPFSNGHYDRLKEHK